MTPERTVPGALRTTPDGDLELTITLTSPTPAALAADILDVAGHLAHNLNHPAADRYVVDALNATATADKGRR